MSRPHPELSGLRSPLLFSSTASGSEAKPTKRHLCATKCMCCQALRGPGGLFFDHDSSQP